MNERDALIVSVANKINTYRQGEVPALTPEYVERWLMQFTPAQQFPFISEFNHVINQTFITLDDVKTFMKGLIKNEKITKNDPMGYWQSVNFLNIQQNGNSQKEMINILSRCLKEEYDINVHVGGDNEGDFIYLDDFMFSGNRIINDLRAWIDKHSPQTARIHVIVIATHTLGEYYTRKTLDEIITDSRKNISIFYWRCFSVENTRRNRNISGVLWPTMLPEEPDVKRYITQLPEFFSRQPQPSTMIVKPFSSEAGRQILEREFLIAGSKIIAKSKNPKPFMRPLGFSPFGLGFGSMLVTYRNCPNNCPLAMWWGSSEPNSGPLDWYPLLARKGYQAMGNVSDDFF